MTSALFHVHQTVLQISNHLVRLLELLLQRSGCKSLRLLFEQRQFLLHECAMVLRLLCFGDEYPISIGLNAQIVKCIGEVVHQARSNYIAEQTTARRLTDFAPNDPVLAFCWHSADLAVPLSSPPGNCCALSTLQFFG